MNRAELEKLIQGPIATVPTAMKDNYEIDYGLMAEMTKWWVDQGLVAGTTVIKVAAAMGEGPDLTDEEWPKLLKTVVDAADGKAAIVCGLKPKDTIHTIEDGRKAQSLGAIGLQIDLPFFHNPTQDDLVRFYSDISDGVENIGVMIYNTWNFGAPSITAESMLRLADAENVVAVKWFVPEGGPDYDDMHKFSHIFNVIDNSLQPARAHKNGARGYINNSIHAHPPHDLKVWGLLEEGKYDEAQALFDQVHDPIRAFMVKMGKRSGGYRVPKAMMAVMGRPFGPMRPPTLTLNEAEMAELHEIMAGFGWPVAAKPVSV